MVLTAESKAGSGILNVLIGPDGQLRDQKRGLYLAPILFQPCRVIPFTDDQFPQPATNMPSRLAERVHIAVAPLDPLLLSEVEKLQDLLTTGLTDLSPNGGRNFFMQTLTIEGPVKEPYIRMGHLIFAEPIGTVEWSQSARFVTGDQDLVQRMQSADKPTEREAAVSIPAYREITLRLFPHKEMAWVYSAWERQLLPFLTQGRPEVNYGQYWASLFEIAAFSVESLVRVQALSRFSKELTGNGKMSTEQHPLIRAFEQYLQAERFSFMKDAARRYRAQVIKEVAEFT